MAKVTIRFSDGVRETLRCSDALANEWATAVTVKPPTSPDDTAAIRARIIRTLIDALHEITCSDGAPTVEPHCS